MSAPALPNARAFSLAVMTMTVAPFFRAISATSSRSRLRPLLLMITAQSPGLSMVALITWMWPSLTAAEVTPRRKNLCCASWATMPELPTP